MSILNTTPDSFSDGGTNDPTDTTALSSTILSHIMYGATILDIGGQSSRPNAPDITSDEETSRILPAVRALQALQRSPPSSLSDHIKSILTNVAISIDTYRSSVAAAALSAGAHIINDISSGQLDPSMLSTVAAYNATVILMHMRGTPATMAKPPHTIYTGDLIETIASELRQRVAEAEAAGIYRWRIILDPGIGFAKTEAQNLEILRRFGELGDAEGLKGLPWVVGSSRKGFIGRITGVKMAKDRGWGTAATVAASVMGGADVVRVHDVKEMGEVCKMSDAIWRI